VASWDGGMLWNSLKQKTNVEKPQQYEQQLFSSLSMRAYALDPQQKSNGENLNAFRLIFQIRFTAKTSFSQKRLTKICKYGVMFINAIDFFFANSGSQHTAFCKAFCLDRASASLFYQVFLLKKIICCLGAWASNCQNA